MRLSLLAIPVVNSEIRLLFFKHCGYTISNALGGSMTTGLIVEEREGVGKPVTKNLL